MAENEQEQPNQISIEMAEDIAEGTYCNLALIAHSNAEFIVDFIRMMPGVPKAKVKARVILTPEHAVRFMNALKENIERYEESFGDIKPNTSSLNNIPFNFGGTIGQA